MEEIVYLNGEFIPYSEAHIQIDDRGYNFADGVYEVVAVYNGKPFMMEDHFIRLQNSAQALEINFNDYRPLMKDALALLEKRIKYIEGAAKIYIQITRGDQPRGHVYQEDLSPNILIFVRELAIHPHKDFKEGVTAITAPDERWPKCYIKSIALLPNIMTKKKARRAGAFEAIQIKDGYITEGTSSNVFIVKDDVIYTPPATNYILNGITRRLIIEEAKKLGFKMTEKSISYYQLFEADEVFLTGTTTEIMPIIEIDGKQINEGQVGPYTRRLFEHYRTLQG